MYYIYKLYDENEKLLYIGKSINISNRIRQHYSDRHRVSWKGGISRIEVSDVQSESDLELYETYYINKLKPPHNTGKLYKDSITVSLPELTFYEYNQSKSFNEIIKLPDNFVGTVYKIYLVKGLGRFGGREIMGRLGISKARTYKFLAEGIKLGIIEKPNEGEYKISDNFLRY